MGAIAGAIVVWYGGGRVTANFGGVDVVPLLGAIAGCHSCVLWLGGEGDDQLWESGCAGCHCKGANLCFMSSFYFQGHQFHPGTQLNNNEFCLELLADIAFFSILTPQNLFFATWGLCWYNVETVPYIYTVDGASIFYIHKSWICELFLGQPLARFSGEG